MLVEEDTELKEESEAIYEQKHQCIMWKPQKHESICSSLCNSLNYSPLSLHSALSSLYHIGNTTKLQTKILTNMNRRKNAAWIASKNAPCPLPVLIIITLRFNRTVLDSAIKAEPQKVT